MSPHASELLASALCLPEDERAAFTEELLASFDPQPGEANPLDDAEFLAELDRRAEELRTDPTLGMSWDTVKGMR